MRHSEGDSEVPFLPGLWLLQVVNATKDSRPIQLGVAQVRIDPKSLGEIMIGLDEAQGTCQSRGTISTSERDVADTVSGVMNPSHTLSTNVGGETSFGRGKLEGIFKRR